MKKNVFYIVAIGIFLLTACGGTPPTDIPINSSAATETATTSDITSLPFPSRTPRERPNEPTVTPLPPTPLPTIPTFTPTFDVRTIVTITPAARAECPEENDRVLLNVHLPQDVAGSIEFDHEENIESFKDFLNAGGAISAIVNELQQAEWIYGFMNLETFQEMPSLNSFLSIRKLFQYFEHFIAKTDNTSYSPSFQPTKSRWMSMSHASRQPQT